MARFIHWDEIIAIHIKGKIVQSPSNLNLDVDREDKMSI